MGSMFDRILAEARLTPTGRERAKTAISAKVETSLFAGLVAEGIGRPKGLFDELVVKGVDETDDKVIDQMARTLALSEDLVDIRNKLVSKRAARQETRWT